MTRLADASNRSRLRVVLALAAVYIIWGSTYLGLRLGLEGFPPYLLNGIRFTIAGGALMGFLWWRGTFRPTKGQVWDASRVGVIMLAGGIGLVTLAQDLGVGSAVAATAVAVVPAWVALFAGLFGSWPKGMEWVGLALGLAGVLALAWEGDFQTTPIGLLVIVLAPVLWSFGSVWGTRLDLPSPLSSTAIQLTAAGFAMTFIGLITGERITSPPSAVAWAALAYLAVFGSLVAFTAFVYLMHTVRPALATSYAYVNPVIAVILGLTIGGETVTGAVFVALPLILASVALLAIGGRRGVRKEREEALVAPLHEHAA